VWPFGFAGEGFKPASALRGYGVRKRPPEQRQSPFAYGFTRCPALPGILQTWPSKYSHQINLNSPTRAAIEKGGSCEGLSYSFFPVYFTPWLIAKPFTSDHLWPHKARPICSSLHRCHTVYHDSLRCFQKPIFRCDWPANHPPPSASGPRVRFHNGNPEAPPGTTKMCMAQNVLGSKFRRLRGEPVTMQSSDTGDYEYSIDCEVLRTAKPYLTFLPDTPLRTGLHRILFCIYVVGPPSGGPSSLATKRGP